MNNNMKISQLMEIDLNLSQLLETQDKNTKMFIKTEELGKTLE